MHAEVAENEAHLYADADDEVLRRLSLKDSATQNLLSPDADACPSLLDSDGPELWVDFGEPLCASANNVPAQKLVRLQGNPLG